MKNKIRLTYLFFTLFIGILSAHSLEHQTSMDRDCVACQLWSSETEMVNTPFELDVTYAVKEMILLRDLQGLYKSSFYSSLHVINPNDRGPPSQI